LTKAVLRRMRCPVSASAMKSSFAIIGAVAALMSPTALRAETWLCIVENATGFSFDSRTKKWEPMHFNVDNRRYVVKKTTDTKHPWEVRKFGPQSSLADAWCEEGFNEAGFLHCSGLGGKFVLNRHTGRFQAYFTGSYVSFNPKSSYEIFRSDGGDTPFIAIGNCSVI
jgi:hypothetical protein